MKRLYLIILFSGFSLTLFAQSVGINANGANPDSSAILDVQSATKGMLLPRMTTDQRDAIRKPAPGLMIYNLDDSCFNYYSGNEWILDCGVPGVGPEISPASLGGSNFELGTAIETDGNGNRLVLGNFSGSTTLGNTILVSSGSQDIFLAKINPQGRVLWAVKAGGIGLEISNDLTVDGQGNVYITGFLSGGSASFGDTTLVVTGSTDGFLAKIDPSGKFVWALLIDGSISASCSGVASDAAGNLFLSCSVRGNITIGSYFNFVGTSSQYAFVTVKLNSSGQVISEYSALGPASIQSTAVSVDGLGNDYHVGYFSSGAFPFDRDTLRASGTVDLFITKANGSSSFVWTRQAGGLNGTIFGYDIAVDPAGNSYVTGTFNGTINFQSLSLTSGGNTDVFVAKLNPAGQFQWATLAGGANRDEGLGITLDIDGNSYITGTYNGSANFGGTNLTSSGSTEIFVAKLNTSGQFVWAKRGPAGSVQAIDFDGILKAPVLTGSYSGTANFGGKPLTSQGSTDVFVWSLDAEDGGGARIDKNLSNSQDKDSDPANELQSLRLSGDTLKLTNGGSVVLPGIAIPDTALPIPIIFHGSTIFVHPDDNATNVNWATAQSTCTNLTAFGFSDWYLPSRLELDAMYKQSYYITGLSQTSLVKYWSSTQIDANTAYSQRLDYGGPDPDPKTTNTSHNCRCIRKN
ncbi:MAG: SBBP repeat-containing protein [Bacteroidia bacterium]|nr:SBBP repeat-containing protein [Bacteroidia bacterium]